MPIHALPNQVCIRRSYAFGVKAVIPLLVFLLLLGFSPCALAQEQSTILLEPTVGGLFKIHATIAGRPGVFLFDSGSGFSNISPAFATEIGCHPWGQITGFRMTGERLDMQHCDHVAFNLAGRSFAASTVGVFDLSKYLPNQVGHIDGTIALDLFENEAFTLSCGGHVLRLLDHKALAVQSAGARGMPIHVVRDAEGLALTVNLPLDTLAGTAWFELDSGNTSSRTLVNKPLAPLFGLPARPNDGSFIRLILADGTTFSGPSRVLDLILDGNLGTSFLETHDVTIDLPHKTGWVKPFVAKAR